MQQIAARKPHYHLLLISPAALCAVPDALVISPPKTQILFAITNQNDCSGGKTYTFPSPPNNNAVLVWSARNITAPHYNTKLTDFLRYYLVYGLTESQENNTY